MADISLTCKGCGHAFSVSEFVDKPEVDCVKCRESIVVPKVSARAKLKLKKRNEGNETEEESVLSVIAENFKERRAEEKKADEVTVGDKVKKVRGAWEWVVFLIIAGILVGAMYLIRNGSPEYLKAYKIAMWILTPVVWISVIAAGFGTSKMVGAFLIICPPYWLYYALSALDHKILRGFATAMIVALGTEMYMLPQHAIINKTQASVNSVIQGTHDMIARPAPVEFE